MLRIEPRELDDEPKLGVVGSSPTLGATARPVKA